MIGWMMALVFFSDAVIVYLNTKEREAWVNGDIKRSLVIEGLGTFAVCISVLYLVRFGWPMVPASVGGALLGRWVAWRW